MEKLPEYLTKLATDKRMELDDRILFLYDTESKTYFTKVLVMEEVDEDGAIYKFAPDEPFHSYDKLRVIRAYTVNNCMNVMMGLEQLQGDCGESEVK